MIHCTGNDCLIGQNAPQLKIDFLYKKIIFLTMRCKQHKGYYSSMQYSKNVRKISVNWRQAKQARVSTAIQKQQRLQTWLIRIIPILNRGYCAKSLLKVFPCVLNFRELSICMYYCEMLWPRGPVLLLLPVVFSWLWKNEGTFSGHQVNHLTV
jgi:hypothetical protein